MKNLLLLTLTIPFMISGVETFKDKVAKLEKFTAMKFNHKEAWLDYMKTHMNESIDLKKKQMKEWHDIKKMHMDQMAKGKKHEELIESKLNDGIKLYKKQCSEWKNLMEKEYKRAQDLGKSHMDEFNKLFPTEGEKEVKNLPDTMPGEM